MIDKWIGTHQGVVREVSTYSDLAEAAEILEARNERAAKRSSRRGFLGQSAKVAAAAGVLMAASKTTLAASTSLPSLYADWNQRNFQEIQNDENVHVAALIEVIKIIGGTPRPEPTFQNLLQPNPLAFAQASMAFENTGVGAYFGAAPYFFNAGLIPGVLSIAFVEAYHSGYLNTLLNSTIVPGGAPHTTALTQQQVVTAVTPYIANLNGGPAPSFSPFPSAQNDIAILNFALLLEYLERDYYNLNVPRLIG